jgi:hypothetical protein
MRSESVHEAWPELPYAAWKDTYATLHLWTQIVGKIKLAQTPWLNHSWQVALQVTPRGLTTSGMAHGTRGLEITFDFVDHRLLIHSSDRATRTIPLVAQSVADFYRQIMSALRELELPVKIHVMPSEIPDPIALDEDRTHASYDPEHARRLSRVLFQADRVLKHFRTGFLGKASPVHFFWGSFDLAVTRFSGRRAPLHPGGIPNLPARVAQEAYSHEVSSAGFWPGNADVDAAFYAYAYPEPPGFRAAQVKPEQTTFNPTLGEFILPYASVRSAEDPDAVLLEFLRSTYEAAADAGHWDRSALECSLGRPRVPRAV